MFYLSLKKMKPRLCSRFIFITGYAGYPRISNFIKAMKCVVLFKPFQMEDLLEAVNSVQAVRGT